MYKPTEQEFLDSYENIRHIAMKHWAKNRTLCDLEDLVSIGITVYQAKLKTYDPTKNDRIMGYCYTRINGAMLDYIGKIHPMGYYAVRKKTFEKLKANYFKKHGKVYQHKQINTTSSLKKSYTESLFIDTISPEDVAILGDYREKFKQACQLVFDDLVYDGYISEKLFEEFIFIIEDVILENENIRVNLKALNKISLIAITHIFFKDIINEVETILGKASILKFSKRKFKEIW